MRAKPGASCSVRGEQTWKHAELPLLYNINLHVFFTVLLCRKKKKVDIHAHIYQAGSGFTKRRTRSYFREYLLVSSEQINHSI